MPKTPPEPPKHIVKQFKIGNTRVTITDDYCVKTKEEVDEILMRIAEKALIALQPKNAQASAE